ncbi:MAG: carbohydrate binding family 9 domain-containing protein [Bacteroidales bacterium]|nr:carbohydrate binding family 9 domain-containing protein [Bacteroidales bacterium]
MMKLKTKLLIIFALLESTLCLAVNDSVTIHKRTYNATRTDISPVIDGDLSDSCWSLGEWQGEFLQQRPYDGKKATYPTEVKVLYNNDYLFVAIRCYDSEPEKINKICMARDQWGGDITGIAFDSYFDKKTAFEFNISAAGQQIDLKHGSDNKIDLNWNSVWEGETAIEDSAWTAEMRIPFSQLRYANQEEHIWGMHVWRNVYRLGEDSQWDRIPLHSSGRVHLFGEIHDIKNIRSSRQIEFLPYISGKYIPERGDLVNDYGSAHVLFGNIGLDTKIGLSSNFILDATINPDFGQVEADPSVLNLTAYETFFKEKRPFFLEGNDIFDYNLGEDRLYYTRRIGQGPPFVPDIEEDHYIQTPENSTILGAAKITGKTLNGLSVGIMESVTAEESSTVYTAEKKVDTIVAPTTNYFVARVIKEKNEANTVIGGIFTSSYKNIAGTGLETLTNREAYTGGIDFVQNWKQKTYFIESKIMASHIKGTAESISELQESSVHQFQRPDAAHVHFDSTRTTLTGTGGYIWGGKKAGSWLFSESITWRSPQFNLNDIGYLRQADYIVQNSNVTFRNANPGNLFREYEISLDQSTSYSFGGELADAQIQMNFENTFVNQWGSSLYLNTAFSSFESRELRGGPALRVNSGNELGIHMETNRSKDIYILGGVHYGFKHGEPSDFTVAHIEFVWHPFNKIIIAPFVLYSMNNNEYQYITTTEEDPEIRYLVGSLKQKTLEFTLRAEWFFKPRISLRFYGSPYFSNGRYSDFYRVEDAGAFKTSERFHRYTETSYSPEDNTWTVTETDNDNYSFSFENPDFTFGQFRTNLVFRWEYRLGSVLYLVWSHDNSVSEEIYSSSFSDNLNFLGKHTGKNVFLIKLSYWFST